MKNLTKVISVLIVMFFANPVFAHKECTITKPCKEESDEQTQTSIDDINKHVNDEFEAHRVWWVSILWEDNILPAMMLMAEQLTAVGMKQVEIVGEFMDAKHQMETQQTLQKLRARAHKDYHPSVGMCEFGSSMKSLAASERQGEMNAVIMAQRSQDRAMGNANTAAAGGADMDAAARLKLFRETHCNPLDNNDGLDYLCEHDQDNELSNSTRGSNPTRGIGAPDDKTLRMNKDIDYLRTLDAPWTLDVNFTDGDNTSTPDEEDILALSGNLFGHEVFHRPGSSSLEDIEGQDISTIQKAFVDARAVMAKRSVAENSFNAIVGMKSAGTAASRDFLEALLKELGIEDATANVKTTNGNKTQLDALLGDNPSYHAQMEVLTKKIYQNPDFYTNLYDKPVNIERKGVALQAIGLMQKFDLFKSYLRNEASISLLLELAVSDLQEEAENNLRQGSPGGEKATTP